MAGSRQNKRAGSGANRGSINPPITVLQSESTATGLPNNPKNNDIVIDASTTGSIVVYVYSSSDSNWR